MSKRIVVRELPFMPSAHRWTVDFCDYETETTYSYDLMKSKYFDNEESALTIAEAIAKEQGYVRIDDRTWEEPS